MEARWRTALAFSGQCLKDADIQKELVAMELAKETAEWLCGKRASLKMQPKQLVGTPGVL